MNFNPKTFCKVVTCLSGTLGTGAQNGASIDTEGWGQLLVTSHLEDDGTAGTMDVKLQESADNSTWADITGATITQLSGGTAVTGQTFSVRKDSRKRYIRAVATIGTNAVEGHVVAVLMAPEESSRAPAAANWVEVGALPDPVSSSFA